MCTLTFVPKENGYVAAMNRDEKLTRPRALPPSRFDSSGVSAVFPRERTGGTWIACNSHGNLLALLNWNDLVPPAAPVPLRSRGLVIPELIREHDLTATSARFAQLDLKDFSPFRLIGVFLEESLVREWRWDGQRREEFEFPWTRRHWFSSSVSDELARRERGRTCENAGGDQAMVSTAWVRDLHQSHDPAPGPFSICVHRDDAATVSYTELHCDRKQISMSYRGGSPCQSDRFDSEISIALDCTRT